MKRYTTLAIGMMLAAAAAVGLVVLGLWRPPAPAASSPGSDASTAAGQAAPVVSAVSVQALFPTPAPTAIPSPTATPRALYAAAQQAAALGGIRHEWQTWNNCGPATLAMYLSYFGSPLNQAAIGDALRPFPDDKNVSPAELVVFARGQGYEATLLVNGSADLLRTLVSNGLPVLLETWHEAEPNGGLGHYRLLVGYDDAAQQWTIYDTYDAAGLIAVDEYQGIRMGYPQLADWWKVFNRTYILVYPPDRAAQVAAILDDFGADAGRMWRDAELRARAELAFDDRDAFAWFNLGSSLVAQGSTGEAASAFSQALALGLPSRMLWYQFGPLEAFLAEGRAQDVLVLTDEIIQVTESIEEIYYWRARALLALGDNAGAQAAVQRSLMLAPGFVPALALLGELQ